MSEFVHFFWFDQQEAGDRQYCLCPTCSPRLRSASAEMRTARRRTRVRMKSRTMSHGDRLPRRLRKYWTHLLAGCRKFPHHPQLLRSLFSGQLFCSEEAEIFVFLSHFTGFSRLSFPPPRGVSSCVELSSFLLFFFFGCFDFPFSYSCSLLDQR